MPPRWIPAPRARPLSVLLAVLALAGCAPSPAPDSRAEVAGGETGADSAGGGAGDTADGAAGGRDSDAADPVIPLTPERPPEALAAALDALFAREPPLPRVLQETYFELLEAGGDARCPGGLELDGADPKCCVS